MDGRDEIERAQMSRAAAHRHDHAFSIAGRLAQPIEAPRRVRRQLAAHRDIVIVFEAQYFVEVNSEDRRDGLAGFGSVRLGCVVLCCVALRCVGLGGIGVVG
jgi:hypothetical protein